MEIEIHYLLFTVPIILSVTLNKKKYNILNLPVLLQVHDGYPWDLSDSSPQIFITSGNNVTFVL